MGQKFSETVQSDSRLWAGSIALRVGRNIQRARKSSGMSAQHLSDGCGATGYPIPRSTIANLESGRKETVSLQELMVIGHVLGIPPMALLYAPQDIAETVEVVPGVRVMSVDAAEMFSYGEATSSTYGDLNAKASSLRNLEQTASMLKDRIRNVLSGEVVPEAARIGQLDPESAAELGRQEADAISKTVENVMKKASRLRHTLTGADIRVWDIPEDLEDAYWEALRHGND